MTLMNEQNEFIRNIITYVSKSMSVDGAIFNSTLYLVTLNGLLYEVDLTGKIDPDYICGFNSQSLSNNKDYIINNDNIFRSVYEKVENIINLKQNNIVFSNDRLREDPIFEEIATAKSSDGASNYFIATDTGIITFITLYRGMFNLNKPDKAGIKLYELYNGNYFLAEFNIFRKKINITFNMYCIFMNFNQRRIL